MRLTVLKEVMGRKQVCARLGTDCSGRLTYEHAYGRKHERAWQIVILCYFHHLGSGLDKSMNRWFALRQASETDLNEFPKANYRQELKYLNSIYGAGG